MLDTKGRRSLAKHLETGRTKGRRTQTWLARTLGIRQAAVSKWVAGAARPEAHLRVAIEVLCGIPQADWMTPREAKLIARVREEAKPAAA